MVPVTERQSPLTREAPRDECSCPPGLQPFSYDSQGRPCPLIVPRSALEYAQRIYKGMWVLPSLPLPLDPYDALEGK
jgi:hypothetical protein